MPQSLHTIPKSRARNSNRGSYRFPAFREAGFGGRSAIKQPVESQIQRPPKRGEGNSVMSGDEADERSAKIARLRQLRLARDAAASAAPHADERGKNKN